jgi:DNA-binding SARP family transcriptional activator
VTELYIELLGGLRVRSAVGRPVRVVSRKSQALLGCLAWAPGVPQSRDGLAAMLWEDSDPELARASLRQALAYLRRCLPQSAAGALHSDSGSVRLDAALVTSDVAELQGLLRDGSPGALARAVELHAGVLLDGLDARSPAFEQWLLERRSELRHQLIKAAERAAAQCVAVGDHAGASAVLQRLVGMEPSNERAQRGLMESLGRQGRYTEALLQYRSCREALRRDLDVSPEPATEALHREMLRRRRAAAPQEPDPEASAASPAVALSPAADAEATLREVVVLVVRLCATGAGVTDDPEDSRRLANAVHARMSTVIGRHGGRVDRPTEGETLASFGLDTVTGNEVEHAVRAALDLVTQAPAGTPGECRLAIGISQGQVLPDAGTRLFPLSGRPVARAHELARAAKPGEVAASPEVAAQLAGRYQVVPRSARPSDCFIVCQGVPNAALPQRQLAGRRAELAMLQTLLERVATSRGEAGIGKSSLLEALAGAARQLGAGVHELQVLDFGQAAHERPMPALVTRLLGLGTHEDEAERSAVVARAVDSGAVSTGDALLARDLAGAALDANALSMLSAMDAEARDRGRARVLHGLVMSAASHAPLLIVVEDIHWADGIEVARLADLAASVTALPVLLALSTRVEGDPTGPAWRARTRGCPVTTLDLAPLADDEARELAGNFQGLPQELVEACLAKASGHPLFLDQLLRSAHSGLAGLPGSVRGLLLARVNRLPADLQRGLHAASVLGSRFSRSALRDVLGEPAYDTRMLEQAGLVSTDGEECQFAHALIREATYESLLRSARRRLHQRSAAWFESREPGLQADHLAAAEDPAAAAAYLRAAVEERRASRLDRAFAHAERSRALARSAPEMFAAIAAMGELSLLRGRTDDAIAAWRECVDLAATGTERASAWLGLATALRIMDRYDEALAALQKAERAAESEADPRLLARLWTLRGNLHFPRGELDACLDAHKQALAYASTAESPEDIARAHGGLGDAHYQRGHMRTAQLEFRRCVELCELHGCAGLKLSYLPMLGVTEAYLAGFEAAFQVSQQSAAAAVQAGDLRAQLLASSLRSSVQICRARYADALLAAERSVQIAREIGAKRFESEGLILGGLSLLGLGRGAEARQLLAGSARLAREAARSYCGPWAIGAMALSHEDPLEGRSMLREGERWLAEGCVSHNYLEFYRYAIEVCLRCRDWQGAMHYADALERYTCDEPLPWAMLVIATGRTLASCGGEPADATCGTTLAATLEEARRVGFQEMVNLLDGPARSN